MIGYDDWKTRTPDDDRVPEEEEMPEEQRQDEPEAVWLAKELLFYADRFGIVAEVSNGRYTDAVLRDVAQAVVDLTAETERLHAVMVDVAGRLRAMGHDWLAESIHERMHAQRRP